MAVRLCSSTVLASETELFASAERKITLDVIQNELTIDVYPDQFYKMVQLALTLPVGSATADCREKFFGDATH